MGIKKQYVLFIFTSRKRCWFDFEKKIVKLPKIMKIKKLN